MKQRKDPLRHLKCDAGNVWKELDGLIERKPNAEVLIQVVEEIQNIITIIKKFKNDGK